MYSFFLDEVKCDKDDDNVVKNIYENEKTRKLNAENKISSLFGD